MSNFMKYLETAVVIGWLLLAISNLIIGKYELAWLYVIILVYAAEACQLKYYK